MALSQKTPPTKRFSKFILSPYFIDSIIILVLLIATVILNLKMIRDGLNGNVDLKWHLTWLQHFSKQFSEGIWYPRWLAGTNYGYGSPTFVFYPPFAYYFGSFLKLANINTQDVVIILFTSGLFLSGLFFYIYGRKKWGKLAALFGSLTYITVPYIIFDIYWRGGLASIFVQAWIPLLWYCTEQSLSKRKWRLGLAICWTIIALTHTPSLLLTFIVWLFYTLFFLVNTSWKIVISTFISAGMGLGIASLYLVPAVLEKQIVNLSIMKDVNGGIPYSLFKIETFQESFGLIFKNLFKLSVSELVSPYTKNVFYIFIHQSLVIIILGVILFICSRYHTAVRKTDWSWLIFAGTLIFFMTGFSEPIWQMSSTLQMVQFAWRLLQIFSFVGAALCATVVSQMMQLPLRPKLFLSVIIVGLLMFNFRYDYKLANKYISLRNPGRGSIEHLEHIVTILNNPYQDNLRDVPEYRPLVDSNPPTPPLPIIDQPKVSVLSGKADIKIEQWTSYRRIFSVVTQEMSKIRVRLYYYPAWHLYINQKSYPLTKLDDGTLELTLDSGVHQVELRHQWTFAFKLGLTLSILSVLALIAYTKYPKIPFIG